MKNTKQKEAILEAVANMRNHPTAEEIYSSLKGDNKKLSLGTVYRNLNAFAGCGRVNKISVPNDCDRFDFRLDRHEHMQCSKCSRIFDVEADIEVNNKSDTRITGYKIMFYGLCNDCANMTLQAHYSQRT